MILVTHPDRPFQLTGKGTPRRHVSIKEYDEEISALYKQVEESAEVEVAPPAEWSEDSARAYVRDVIRKVMSAPGIGDDDDLFQQGCDRCASPACAHWRPSC